MSEQEFVELTIKVPKPVYEFHKGLAAFLRESMENRLAQLIVKEVHFILDDFSSVVGDEAVERYSLENYLPDP